MKEIPQPDAVVALAEELTRCPWPKTQSEKDALFKRLGWNHKQQFPVNSNSAGHVADHFQLETREDGPPIVATSRELGGLLEAIHVDLRMDSAPRDPEATHCFDAILSQMTNLHGEPSIPWHGQRGLRKMWNVNGIDIDITWNDSRSSLTIGIQDERFFADVEAYARANSVE